VKKRILFTGGSGLLATNWAIQIRDDYEVILGIHQREITLIGTNSIQINLNSELNIEHFLNEIKPDILIHTAGITNVEQCELNPNEAFKINSIISGLLAKLSKKHDIYFIHISTDHLFDGLLPFASEDTPVSPLNEYGKSKALAEKLILNENTSALILRTNFFGWGTKYRVSFSDFIINSLNNKKKIILYDDVFFTPILIETFVDIAMQLIKKNIKGIINIVGNERITKYNFGVLLAKIFEFDTRYIIRGSIQDNKTLFIRPYDMSLSTKKIHDLLDISLPILDKQFCKLKSQKQTGIELELKAL
jgi:dTDP-4-dehydrorhamnose reductase